MVAMTFAITPLTFWKTMWNALEKTMKWASKALSFVYCLLEQGLDVAMRLWAFLQEFVFSRIINHRAVLWLYRSAIEPLWNIRWVRS